MKIGAIPNLKAMQTQELPSLEELAGKTVSSGAIKAAGPLGGIDGAQGPGGALRTEFTTILDKAVTEVEGKMRAAEVERQKVLTGETNSLHQATIAASEAGIAFSLMVEVRNKLVESYQEILRMQV
jgi:flagellar hook-basal body complex protein FliE